MHINPGSLISIIVPVYNSEKYLEKCIKSIIAQTYTEWELILVDDGSSDNSAFICDSYSSEYNNIIAIHKKNGGVSSARNLGLEICKGDYVSFVDSDDYIHPQFLEILYFLIKLNDADISQCRSKFVKKYHEKNSIVENLNNLQYEIIDRDEAAYRCVKSKNALYYCIACDKLFSKKIINTICFPDIKNAEDVQYCIEAIFNASKIVICDLDLYYYFKHPGSATTSSAYLSENLITVFNYFDMKCKSFMFNKEMIDEVLEASFMTKLDSLLEDYWNAYRLKDKQRMIYTKELCIKMQMDAKNKDYQLRKKSVLFQINPILLILARYIFLMITHS